MARVEERAQRSDDVAAQKNAVILPYARAALGAMRGA